MDELAVHSKQRWVETDPTNIQIGCFDTCGENGRHYSPQQYILIKKHPKLNNYGWMLELIFSVFCFLLFVLFFVSGKKKKLNAAFVHHCPNNTQQKVKAKPVNTLNHASTGECVSAVDGAQKVFINSLYTTTWHSLHLDLSGTIKTAE